MQKQRAKKPDLPKIDPKTLILNGEYSYENAFL